MGHDLKFPASLTSDLKWKLSEKHIYFVYDNALHLLFLLKQLDPVVQLLLEKQQVRCVCFLSGLAGFPLGPNLHLHKTTISMRWLCKWSQACCYDIRKENTLWSPLLFLKNNVHSSSSHTTVTVVGFFFTFGCQFGFG